MCVRFVCYCCCSSFHCLQFSWQPSRRLLLFSEAHVHAARRPPTPTPAETPRFDHFCGRKKINRESSCESKAVICGGGRWSRSHSRRGAAEKPWSPPFGEVQQKVPVPRPGPPGAQTLQRRLFFLSCQQLRRRLPTSTLCLRRRAATAKRSG